MREDKILICDPAPSFIPSLSSPPPQSLKSALKTKLTELQGQLMATSPGAPIPSLSLAATLPSVPAFAAALHHLPPRGPPMAYPLPAGPPPSYPYPQGPPAVPPPYPPPSGPYHMAAASALGKRDASDASTFHLVPPPKKAAMRRKWTLFLPWSS